MVRFLSPVALSHLEAFRYWLRGAVEDWDIALPKDEVVEVGKEYPFFQLYQRGVPVGLVDSPIAALERIGDSKLLEEYLRIVTEDPDDPVA
ncbi:hypothetical protein [Noviherbaspirillum sp. ST9]|uniref:hypothetical protein n=1 Tax=Noviherbaspirillum sp. ST9 TaxID=3401606 RepID=UPI003B58B002